MIVSPYALTKQIFPYHDFWDQNTSEGPCNVVHNATQCALN